MKKAMTTTEWAKVKNRRDKESRRLAQESAQNEIRAAQQIAKEYGITYGHALRVLYKGADVNEGK